MAIEPHRSRYRPANDAGPLWRRLLWFAGIWAASLAALAIVAAAIRAVIL